MAEKDAWKRPSGNTGPEIRRSFGGELRRRYPVLYLERGDPEARILAPLHADHVLYPVAAWVFHHAHRLDEASREGLYAALDSAWPRGGGRPRSRTVARTFVKLLTDAGVPAELVAEGLVKSVGDVQDLVREAKSPRPRRPPEIVPVEATSGAPELPYDPQTLLGQQLARGPEEVSWIDDFELAEKLARDLGYKSLQDLVETGYPRPVQA